MDQKPFEVRFTASLFLRAGNAAAAENETKRFLTERFVGVDILGTYPLIRQKARKVSE